MDNSMKLLMFQRNKICINRTHLLTIAARNTTYMTQVHTVASIHANVILTAVRDVPLVMEMPVRTENQTIASEKKSK
jgi:hypothetical protein